MRGNHFKRILVSRADSYSSIDRCACVLYCDMIKGKELDVTDIAFEILAKKESQLFHIVLRVDTFLTTL